MNCPTLKRKLHQIGIGVFAPLRSATQKNSVSARGFIFTHLATSYGAR